MANFPMLTLQYDGPEVEAIITDMEQELQDEVTLHSTLENANVADRIIEAQEFIENNEILISAQLERLQTLNTQIRAAVLENEQLEADSAEYQELVTSQSYVDLANKILAINAIATSLADFLVQKGRRGRPPLN